VPIQDAENCRASSALINFVPAVAKANVTSETTKAHERTDLSSFIKKEAIPPINGTKKSNKTIIVKTLRQR
jgi:hypothetical protein